MMTEDISKKQDKAIKRKLDLPPILIGIAMVFFGLINFYSKVLPDISFDGGVAIVKAELVGYEEVEYERPRRWKGDSQTQTGYRKQFTYTYDNEDYLTTSSRPGSKVIGKKMHALVNKEHPDIAMPLWDLCSMSLLTIFFIAIGILLALSSLITQLASKKKVQP